MLPFVGLGVFGLAAERLTTVLSRRNPPAPSFLLKQIQVKPLTDPAVRGLLILFPGKELLMSGTVPGGFACRQSLLRRVALRRIY